MKRNKMLPHYSLLGLLLGFVLASPLVISYFADDAYIHARIVTQLLSTGAPVFNVGDHFKADSSTGFVYLLAMISVFAEPLTAARWLLGAVVVITSVLLMLIWKTSPLSRIRKTLASAAMLPFFLVAAYSGMETPIVCMIMAASVLANQRQCPRLAMFLIACSTWFRFEAIALLALFAWHMAPKMSRRDLLLCCTPFFALACLEYRLFGTMIPHAALAKSIAYGLPLVHSMFQAAHFKLGYAGVPFGLLLALFFVDRGFSVLKNRLKLSLSDVFFAFAALVYLGWALGGALIFFWYYCLLSFSFGLAVMLDESASQDPTTAKLWRRHATTILLLFIVVSGGRMLIGQLRNSFADDYNTRVERYREIGAALYAECPDCSLATTEIGALGYSFRGTLYDAFGLTEPDALTYHPLKVPEERHNYGVGAIPPRYIQWRKPDFIVSLPAFSEALRKEGLPAGYKTYDCPLREKSHIRVFNNENIQIFARAPLTARTLVASTCHRAR